MFSVMGVGLGWGGGCACACFITALQRIASTAPTPQYEKTTSAVYEVENSVTTLVDLMSIYREKGGAIFTKCCMLLAILGSDAQRRAVSFFFTLVSTLFAMVADAKHCHWRGLPQAFLS